MINTEPLSLQIQLSEKQGHEDKYKELHGTFKKLVKKSDEMNELLIDVPVPVKKIIEGNEFYRSFFKK